MPLPSPTSMLNLPEPPDAFFAVNDETALGILNVVKAKGA